ncbi:MetQ/NlpA family ABC transporter substrate-binding protein [Vagococcus vulneris]|uniref:Lipoprotein n=1 Tax=Vagococcus vulneris TaxID=1977869 RepID=A0A430A0Y6_9ENTE|nr:MetQ/NlpA family ABC transporter substrate-binding protein [Vagococcus vulneris]RSU00040.1 methionine ABC transporter substrate-binding protein [Vagococcus vulneris]
MKKKLLTLGLLSLVTIGLVACGSSKEGDKKADSGKKSDNKTIVVGASPTPHAEILEQAKPLLKEKGYDLDIKVFNDYILPNKALAEKELDANYFQHIPYFNQEVKEKGYDFTNAGAVHLEKMAFYSQKIKDIKELPEGATIITSNSNTDWGRIITILQDADLVKVKKGTDLTTATFDDIEENPKKLKFKHDIDPAILATAYQNKEGDMVAINANFAEGIGLNPEKDGLLVEKDNSPYANIIVVRTEDKDSAKTKALVEALHDEKIKKFVDEKWKGTIKIVD